MAVKPQTGGGQSGNTTAQDIVGAALGTITKRLTALEDADRGLTTSVVTIPEVDLSFTPVFRRDKKGVWVTLAFFIPPTATGLRVSLIRTAKRSSAEQFQENRFGENLRDIEDSERAAGRIVREIPVRLEYDTQYDLFRLRATTTDSVGDSAQVFNPSEEPLFNDVPLLQFTTPEAFGVPSSPNAALILVNELDPTTKDYDGYVVVRIHAPLNVETGAAQTYRQALVDHVVAKFTRVGTSERPTKSHVLSSTELDQVDAGSTPANRGYVDVTIRNFRPGSQYTWDANVAWTNGEKRTSTGAAVTLYGAGLRLGTNGLPELTGVSLTATVDGDIADSSSATVTLAFTQSTPAIALRKIGLRWKKTSGGAYPADPQRTRTLHKDDFHANGGSYTIILPGNKIKPRKDWDFELVITGEGDIGGGVPPKRTVTTTLDATALNDPSAPSVSGFVLNTLNPNTKEHDATVVFRVWAPLTDAGAAQTMRQAQVEKAWVLLSRPATGAQQKIGGALTETELDQVDPGSTPANRGFTDIEAELKVADFFWLSNIIEGLGELHTATSAVAFKAGGLATATAGITELTSVSLTTDQTDPYDGKNTLLKLNFTQPATPVALRFATVEVSIDGGSIWKIHTEHVPLKDDALHTAGAKVVSLTTVRTKKLVSNQYRVTIKAQGGETRTVSLTQTAADAVDGAALPTAIAFPSAPTGSNNTVDGDPEKAHARIALTLATVSGTFAANNVSQIEIVLIRRNATNTADVGNPFSEIKVLSTADLAASSCVHEFFLRMGQKFRITKVVARNGDKRAETTGTADFTAGGVLQVDTGDAKTVAAPSFFVQPTPHDTDSNKEVDFTVRLTQDGTDIVLYKRLVIERQTASGGWKLWTEVPLMANDPLHASVTGSADFAYVSRRKAGKTVTFRATAYAVGGKASATTTSSTLAASGSDLLTDAAAPGSLPTPTLKFKRGKLFAKLDLTAVTNLQTLNERIEVSIHNGTNSLNLDDPTSESIVSGIVLYMLGKASNLLPYDKDQLLRIFGSGANLKARYKLTNNAGSTTTGDSADLPLSDQRDITSLYNPTNLLKNGHFVFNNGTTAKVWEDYNPTAGSFGVLDNTGKMRLDTAEHRAKWRDITTDADHRFMVQNLGKTFFKSEYYSFTWNIYSNGTPTIDELVVGLYTQKTLTNTISATGGTNTVTGTGFDTDGVKVGTIIGRAGSDPQWRTVTALTATSLTVDRNWAVTFSGATGRALIPQSTRLVQTNVALSTADKFQKGTVLTDSDLDVTRDIYFAVVLRDTVDTTTFPFIDAVCMNPGQESGGYQRSFDTYETNFAGTAQNFDTAPTGGSSSGGAQPPGGTGGDPGEILPILT